MRLAYIDAPEEEKPGLKKPGQPMGSESAKFLNDMLQGQEITARVVEAPKGKNYWRPVVEVRVGDKYVNQEMLKNGYAWRQNRTIPTDLWEAGASAERNRMGIFSDRYAESPGLFRMRYYGTPIEQDK